ncbi:sugar efflux transporter [Celerinatantimonas yamalensis]|uniref:Sugar efflux transporter n=1 Tax=Celerinatantimonas yamalensis TaxID=559956 RepID=A0ABW9G2E3_9GAMM
MLTTYWRQLRSAQASVLLSFMTLTFFTGLGGALFIPTLSLFLTTEVHVEPFAVGLFYTFNAIGGIVFTQLVARYSDKYGQRKRIILICLLMGALNCLLFDWCRSYLILITIGIVLLGMGASAMPQSFALARDYKDQSKERSMMFTTIMRAQLSLAWVVGPAIAFALITAYGFHTLFLFGTAVYVLGFFITLLKLPDVAHQPSNVNSHEQSKKNRGDIYKLFVCSTLMWGCNSMYIISMPLYVSHQLHLPQELAGWMMGMAAALEIPIMLIAGYLTKYWKMRSLLIASGVAGTLFYLGMNWFDSPHMLLALQLGNAAFIGVLGGLGMIYFQELLPSQTGQATTLFTNSIYTGSVIAGACAGVIAQYLSYGAIFIVSGCFVALATLLLTQVKPI